MIPAFVDVAVPWPVVFHHPISRGKQQPAEHGPDRGCGLLEDRQGGHLAPVCRDDQVSHRGASRGLPKVNDHRWSLAAAELTSGAVHWN